MNISSAQYWDRDEEHNHIIATIDGVVMSVPLDPDNIHYAEILKQVEEGLLTIKDAD